MTLRTGHFPAFLLLSCFIAEAHSEQFTAHSSIDNDALRNSSGVVGVNVSAGDANAQMNAHAIAIHTGGGTASTSISSRQSLVGKPSATPALTSSYIGKGAFADASGLVAVNQVSGSANLQLNSALIGLGIEGTVVSESMLATTVSDRGVEIPSSQEQTWRREAHVGEDAFRNAKGLVQINQLSGVRNVARNSFTLNILLGNRAE